MQDVASCVERYGACPDDLTEESSLGELLSSKDLYSQEPKNLARFSWPGLRLLKHKVRPNSALIFLPPVHASRLRHYKQHNLLPPDEELRVILLCLKLFHFGLILYFLLRGLLCVPLEDFRNSQELFLRKGQATDGPRKDDRRTKTDNVEQTMA